MMQPDSSSRELYDLCDGDLFQEPCSIFKTEAIQIQLLCDGFETVNPLGSKQGKQNKLGAIYFNLCNFSPKFKSFLLNSNLVALFHAQDIKTWLF